MNLLNLLVVKDEEPEPKHNPRSYVNPDEYTVAVSWYEGEDSCHSMNQTEEQCRRSAAIMARRGYTVKIYKHETYYRKCAEGAFPSFRRLGDGTWLGKSFTKPEPEHHG